MKKLLGFLVVLCLIVGLLPVVALAAPPEGWVTDDVAYIKIGDAPSLKVYRDSGECGLWRTDANGNVSVLYGANAQAALADGTWNVKLEYVGDVATLTLKDATIGGCEGETFQFPNCHGIQVNPPSMDGGNINMTIVLEGTNKVYSNYAGLDARNAVGELIIKGQEGASLAFLTHGTYNMLYGAKNLVFDNAKVSFDSVVTNGGWKGAIVVENMSVINGSDLYVVGNYYGFVQAPIKPTKQLLVDNSKLTVYSKLCRAIMSENVIFQNNANVDLTIESGNCAIYATETLTVENSTLKAVHLLTSDTDFDRDLIASATASILFKNSNVTLERGETDSSYMVNPIRIEETANLTIDGGTVNLITDTEDGAYALMLDSGATAAIKGNATVNMTGLVGIVDENALTVEGGVLTVTGDESMVEGEIVVNGGKVVYTDVPEVTEPPETEPPATEPPATSGENNTDATTDGTENDSTEGTVGEENTEGTTGADNTQGTAGTQPNATQPAEKTDSNGVLWIVAGVILVLGAVGAACYFLLRKKPAAEACETTEE